MSLLVCNAVLLLQFIQIVLEIKYFLLIKFPGVNSTNFLFF